MHKRICSLETEYALVSNLVTHDRVSRDDLADLIEQAVLSNYTFVRCNSFGRRSRRRTAGGMIEIKEGQFIDNGSRVYYDVGHFEWANPETLDPRSAVLYDQAAERTLAEAVSLANAQLQETYPNGWVMLVKNNIDYRGNASYGCHENYSLRRYTSTGQDIFARLTGDLVPFLVTRQIYCGAGRIGARDTRPDDPVAFQLSQRADFIETLESPKTREERGILNQRDEPLADSRAWRRLHLIVGDSNMAEYAALLKIGTTSLALDLTEAGMVRGRFALRDPVSALHQVSRDWQHALLPLRKGGRATALTIQRGYCEMARQIVSGLPVSHFGHGMIRLWDQTLEDLAHDRPGLHRRLDWAIKRHHLFDRALQTAGADWKEMDHWAYVCGRTGQIPLPPDAGPDVPAWLKAHLPHADFRHLDRYVKAHRLDWRLYPSRRCLLDRLREMDFRYHDLNREHSLYALIAGERGQEEDGRIDRVILDQNEITAAQHRPPRDTRAWQRGQIIDLCSTREVALEMDWDKVLLVRSNRIIEMPDPFAPEPIDLRHITGPVAATPRAAQRLRQKNLDIKIISVENLAKD